VQVTKRIGQVTSDQHQNYILLKMSLLETEYCW